MTPPPSFFRHDYIFLDFENVVQVHPASKETTKTCRKVVTLRDPIFGIPLSWVNVSTYTHKISIIVEMKSGDVWPRFCVSETSGQDKESYDWKPLSDKLTRAVSPLLDAYGEWLTYSRSLLA